jgi:predicted Rossmann-fold nucleotide-binding protein
LTLIQTNRIERFPVVLIGKKHWSGLIRWMRSRLSETSLIGPEDLALFHLTDSPEEAVRVIADYEKRVAAHSFTRAGTESGITNL